MPSTRGSRRRRWRRTREEHALKAAGPSGGHGSVRAAALHAAVTAVCGADIWWPSSCAAALIERVFAFAVKNG